MAKEYLEREAAIAAVNCTQVIVGDWIRNNIQKIPAADVAPVVRGRWIYKHRHRGGFRVVTGEDEYGNQHTIQIDERYEIDEPYCSECGKLNEAYSLNFCPNCGAKMEVQNG